MRDSAGLPPAVGTVVGGERSTPGRSMEQRMDFETILYEPEGRVLTITLNRPEHRNAISQQLSDELGDAWIQFRDDPGLDVAILTGAGDRVFCSGADLKEVADYYAAKERGEEVGDQPLSKPLAANPHKHHLTKPIICAVNGFCVGAGLTFVADADIVICSDNAAFFDPHVSWGGLNPGLVRLIGKLPVGEIFRLGLLGNTNRLLPDRAFELGLVSEVTTLEGLLPKAREYAERILSLSQPAVRAQKDAIWQGLETFIGPAYDASRAVWTRYREESQNKNLAEGASAFAGHRRPDYAK